MSSSRRVALFAEGSHHLDARRLDRFVELWKFLAQKCDCQHELHVFGFNKAQIVAMAPPSKWNLRYEPLDLFIGRKCDEFKKTPIDTLLIAFDTEPKHDGLERRCRRNEVLKLLEGLQQSSHVPARFCEEAQRLLARYQAAPTPLPRPSGRPPRGPLDVLAMEPMFEALLLADEPGVRKALGVPRAARGWPSFRPTLKPDRDILEPARKLAGEDVRRKLRGDFSGKHGLADYILRHLPDDSLTWQHPLFERLRVLLA